jgi:uncharacterized protein YvpB
MSRILRVPYIDQTERWVYGCESVSAVMLLRYFGIEADPDTFIDRFLPRACSAGEGAEMVAPDPADFYINDPRDRSGWGCYAPCICTALRRALAAAGRQDDFTVCDDTGKTAAQLCAGAIDAGLPAVFWATLDFEPSQGTTRWTLPDGRPFDWKNHEHCLLLAGYDDESYWFNDPWHNHGCCPYPKELVERRHREQGMYAVTLRPNRTARP